MFLSRPEIKQIIFPALFFSFFPQWWMRVQTQGTFIFAHIQAPPYFKLDFIFSVITNITVVFVFCFFFHSSRGSRRCLRMNFQATLRL